MMILAANYRVDMYVHPPPSLLFSFQVSLKQEMAEMNADTEMGSAQQEHIQGLYNLDYDLQLDKSLPPLSTTEPMENALVAQTQALELGTETPTEKMGREPGPSNVSRVQL